MWVLRAWHEWLEQAIPFAFRGQRGAYTARREQIKPGDWYWYAYQRSQKRVQKKYLGKSEAISLQRLEEVAARLQRGKTVEDETAISTMSSADKQYGTGADPGGKVARSTSAAPPSLHAVVC